MGNYTESRFGLTVLEADLGTYMRVYRSLKESFKGESRFFVSHVEGDLWEVQLIGLHTRDWLEFCANVYAELPTETVNLVEEAQEYSLSDPEGTNDVEEEDVLEGEEYEDDDSVEEEVEESEEESPSEEVDRKLGQPLRKAKLVRKTGASAVTVESD